MRLKINDLIFILAFAGFIDSVYLTATRFLGGVPPCLAVSGCESVLISPYSAILGVPVSLIGIFYYAGILLFRNNLFYSKLIVSAGLLGTAYFIYLQGYVIGAWCFYCLISAGITSVLFPLIFLRKN